MKQYIIKKLLPDAKLWKIAGNIAERFHDKETGEYDDLQDKMYIWIKMGIYEPNNKN